MDFFKLVV